METTNPKPDTNSINFPSRWSDLPGDVLATIADRIDTTIGLLRLRSVCSSWSSSLSLSSSPARFPLKLPFPFPFMSSTSPSPSHIFLLQHTVYYFSHVSGHYHGFLVKVEEKVRKRLDSFSLIDPLGSSCVPCKKKNRLNLLNYSISVICKAYAFERVDARVPIKKVAVAKNFVKDDDFVVMGLCDNGVLLLWRFGDENWTQIAYNGRPFDDIISYKGKFYATADGKGRLVMIDSRLKPIDLVHRLMYGCGEFTHLVENDGELYLLDRVWINEGLSFGVFKLDGKSRFWDFEPNLNDSVFFIGNDANFALTKKNYRGCIRNCIFFIITHEEGPECHDVFDVKKGTTCSMVDSHPFFYLYRPHKLTGATTGSFLEN